MSNQRYIEIEEIPQNPIQGSVFLIRANGLSDFTHGIFKYPCKFIPHIPRWFIKKYSNKTTKKYGILDPFVGSGTTLVESSLMGFPSYGIDVDPLSCLLSKVKTTTWTKRDKELLKSVYLELKDDLKNKRISKSHLAEFTPPFNGLNYWFPEKSINDLATIKYLAHNAYKKNKNSKILNLLLITLASIIRKVSFAEEQSPKPYISTKIKKEIPDTKKLFLDYLDKYSKAVISFSEMAEQSPAKIIGYDARKIDKKPLTSGKVHLVMTSPPYINAFDYVRSLKLENLWLDLITEKDISDLYDKHIGTEKISAERYSVDRPKSSIESLDRKLSRIYRLDKKRSYIVADFFEAMRENLQEIYKTLLKNGCYCLVVGDSKIKGVYIPTGKIITAIAEQEGFKLVNDFSYIIRNRYLRIPRKGRGGFIAKDNVLVFKK